MTLTELAAQYAESAEKLTCRIKILKEVERHMPTGRERIAVGTRIRELSAMCRETHSLAGHMRGYYDRRKKRDARYTI